MMTVRLALLLVFIPGWSLPAQEVVWQRASTASAPLLIGGCDTFGDVNGDGNDDLIVGVITNYTLPGQQYEVQFWSGADGSLVHTHVIPQCQRLISLWGTGDVDGDGSLDFAFTTQMCPLGISPDTVTVYSTSPPYAIWSATMPMGSSFGWYAGDGLDVDGDGRNEVLITATAAQANQVFVYNSNGTQRYVLNALPYGMAVLSVAAVGDIDGDSGDDFIVGCSESTGRGAVILVSGRTGTILRVSFGLQAWDVLGESTAAAGDVDGDGVPDYIAGSSTVNPRGLVVLFSGATGVPIHTWTAGYGHSLVGRLDVDQDGVADVVTGSPGYYNGPNSYGRVQAFSGRDGQFLWEMHPTYSYTNIAATMASLGVQPGSPYPVVAYSEPGYSIAGYGRITAVRTNLLGTGAVVGPGCGASAIPRIGVRRQGSGSRITISDGPPGSVGWIALGLAMQTSYGGYSLPLLLDPYGLVGCSLLVAPVNVGVRLLGATGLDSGYAFADLPNAVSATGLLVAAQWLAIDPLSGSFAMSPRHEFRLQ